MLYLDFDWDVHRDRIVLDSEFNTDKLGWKHGDMFKLINVNGKQQLVKVDQVEQFIKGYPVNKK